MKNLILNEALSIESVSNSGVSFLISFNGSGEVL